MRLRTQAGLVVALLGLTIGPSLVAQDDAVLDRTPRNCVDLSRIRSTKIVDDNTILFYMRGGRIYRNILDRECPRLEQEGRFMYEVTAGRLCDIDTITVLDRFGGGFNRGFTCRLGEFQPITAEEAEAEELISEDEAGGDGSFEVTPVELPPEDRAPEPE